MSSREIAAQAAREPLTYEQEVHALLYAAAASTRDLLRYFEAQAATEKGKARKLTEKCIAWKREDLERIHALIPQALERRDALRAIEESRQPEVNENFVEKVEDCVGMGHGAWDMVDPVEICKGVLKVAAERRQEPPK